MKWNAFSKIILAFITTGNFCLAQNPLFIPPTLTGTSFNLNIQNGTTQFFTGINTPTYGINGNILAPTIIVSARIHRRVSPTG